MGYNFKDFDKASRWTWKFLRDSTTEQVRAVANYALEADNKLTTGTILQRLFDPTQDANSWGHPVYGLYNGDTMVPPAYLGKGFTAAHQHYLVSEAETIDSGDLEAAIRHVAEHGYGTEPNSRLLALLNPAQAEVVSQWKAGQESATGVVAKHDYVPSAGAPAYLQPENIVGQIAPESYNGLKVQGSYGPVWIIQSDFIPAGYFAVVATFGPNNPDNVIGFRQHPQAPISRTANHSRPCSRIPIAGRILSAQRRCRRASTRPSLCSTDQRIRQLRHPRHPEVMYGNPFHAMDLEALDAEAGEFSWGPNLEPPHLRDAPPSEGGRYRGTTPPCDPQVRASRR